MNHGLLNTRIEFYSPPSTKDDGGEFTGEWRLHAKAWAYLKDSSANQGIDEKSEVASMTRTYTVRWRKDITTSMRIKYYGLWWEITGIMERSRRDYIEILTINKSNW
jgi:SPP1 family predicted phage head-tail adaptor